MEQNEQFKRQVALFSLFLQPGGQELLQHLSERFPGTYVKGEIQRTYDNQVEKSVVDYIKTMTEKHKHIGVPDV